jgi:prepilin-type N-terminal cleavage/methylation domain-containing protein
MINKVRTKTKVKAKIKAKTKHRRSMAFMSSKQRGFTLIELLVVVSILAALAGITSVAMDGYQQDSEEKLTRVEMQRISNAIRRFKADTGYWPKTESTPYTYDKHADPANFGFLFSQTGTSIPSWTPEYTIGWHGPYVNLDAIKTIIVDEYNTPKPNGCADTEHYPKIAVIDGLATDEKRMNGLVDRFEKVRQNSSKKVKEQAYEYCILTKKKTKDDDGNIVRKWDIEDISASPYLYEKNFTHSEHALCSSNNCIALRSFGADGKDGYHSDAIDEDRYDDIVFVLEVN